MKTNINNEVAGGLLDRRLFLQRGLVFSTVIALPAEVLGKVTKIDPVLPKWMLEPGAQFSNYGQPSVHENKTIRWTMGNKMADGNGVSWTPLQDLEGTITPNGLHFERHHNGVPQIDPAEHQLMIHGLVKKPLVFSMKTLLRYPMQSCFCFIECGGNSNAGWRKNPIQSAVGYFHGMASCSEWTGVPLHILLHEAGIQASAKWVIAEGADAAAMNISMPLEKLMDDCILALYQNGEKIRPENGYPLRLVAPGWEGVVNVKWLRRLHLSDRPSMTRNETSKYTELLPSGKARQFTFVMGVKSVITSPAYGYKMDQPGLYQITGLAWSGRGKIKAVEVSADAGKTWTKAELQEPVLAKCFTRFRIPWQWGGEMVILQSRAIDETGSVQPTREQLVAERGRHGYFHYNAIVSWEISAAGGIRHVYA